MLAQIHKERNKMMPLPDVETVLAQLTRMGITVPAPTEGRVTVDGYGDSPELSESLLALIRSGQKRAGTSLLWTMEEEKDTVPQVGDIALVVNHLNQPALICRNTQVEIVPYNQGRHNTPQSRVKGAVRWPIGARRTGIFSRASVNASDENPLKPCRWYVRYLSY